MVKKGPENVQLVSLIKFLEQSGARNKVAIWKKTAFLLSKPTRQRPEVNLRSIDCNSSEGDFVIVPGKVLSEGRLTHKVTLAAFRVSKPASEKLSKAGCKTISIKQLVESNPKGSKIVFLVK
ncbi:TPA: 50S ribosomal protein L18e [Candidatus Micrarchaeota archaeon]|nr:MAG: 50S ribosomal protein L18e [Candidatus Micrarchaeota archaeon CG1_02_51_15]HII38987.1 50S ribosomal protein L18e [Candidatus Micrarchaeota archaeon]